MNVVLNFHKGDQISAKLLLETLLHVDEGIECEYHLHYGDEISTLVISDTLLNFIKRKKTHFSNELPRIVVPKEMIQDDPNQAKFEGNHTNRSKAQKFKILQWNLCLFKYLQSLDSFLMIEPDSAVFKNGWLEEIHSGWNDSEAPIFGHLKKGKIHGDMIPTHWAGSSVYDAVALRSLPLEKYFYERYDNPWWPYRNEPDTPTANNCFWGPVFSGYDISYDYFLFGLYWREKTGLNDPFHWPLSALQDRQDLIFCDFNTRMKTDEILGKYSGRLPLMHGIKSDEVREKNLKYFLAADTKALNHLPLSAPPASRLPRDNSKFFTIRDLKNMFPGERCFIIGNGPSLRSTDLRRLKGEYTIGLNRIYLNFDNMDFQPTFHCVVNPNVLEQFGAEIDGVNSIKFIRKESRQFIRNLWNTFFVDSLPGLDFNKNFESLGWYEGWTVTYCAMQVAYYLGFKDVVLVGVDHNFVQSGEPNKLVTSDGADPNHFHPNYFGKGIKWQYPDLERSEQAYNIAKKIFGEDGRTIVDATVNGKLQVFPKVEYQSLFDGAETGFAAPGRSPAGPPLEQTQPVSGKQSGTVQSGHSSDRLKQLRSWIEEFRSSGGNS